MTRKPYLEKAVLVILTTAISVIGGMLIYYLYINPSAYFAQKALLRRLEVLVAGLALVANIGLTLGLIYIYLNQNRVLQDEISVLKSQQKIMRLAQQPEIGNPYDVEMFGEISQETESSEDQADDDSQPTNKIELPNITGEIEIDDDVISIEVHESTKKETPDPPEDGIRFRLSNNGGGIARNFRLWSRLIVHEGPHEGMWTRSPLERLDRYSLYKYGENTMQSGEQDIRFQGKVHLKIREPPKEEGQLGEFDTYSFSEGVQKLTEEGTEEIEVTLELRYEDAFEEEDKNQFYHKRATISQDMDWEEFTRKESPKIRYINKSNQELEGTQKVVAWLESLTEYLFRLLSRD